MSWPDGDQDLQSYPIHTGRELELMLAGSKPLACFCDAHPEEDREEIIPKEAFAPYLAEGRFVSREYVEPLREPPPNGHAHIRGTLYVLYARPSEEWRIDAFILLKSIAARIGWSEGFERMEGTLLGYEEWQNDMHLERLRTSDHTKNWYWVQRQK